MQSQCPGDHIQDEDLQKALTLAEGKSLQHTEDAHTADVTGSTFEHEELQATKATAERARLAETSLASAAGALQQALVQLSSSENRLRAAELTVRAALHTVQTALTDVVDNRDARIISAHGEEAPHSNGLEEERCGRHRSSTWSDRSLSKPSIPRAIPRSRKLSGANGALPRRRSPRQHSSSAGPVSLVKRTDNSGPSVSLQRPLSRKISMPDEQPSSSMKRTLSRKRSHSLKRLAMKQNSVRKQSFSPKRSTSKTQSDKPPLSRRRCPVSEERSRFTAGSQLGRKQSPTGRYPMQWTHSQMRDSRSRREHCPTRELSPASWHPSAASPSPLRKASACQWVSNTPDRSLQRSRLSPISRDHVTVNQTAPTDPMWQTLRKRSLSASRVHSMSPSRPPPYSVSKNLSQSSGVSSSPPRKRRSRGYSCSSPVNAEHSPSHVQPTQFHGATHWR